MKKNNTLTAALLSATALVHPSYSMAETKSLIPAVDDSTVSQNFVIYSNDFLTRYLNQDGVVPRTEITINEVDGEKVEEEKRVLVPKTGMNYDDGGYSSGLSIGLMQHNRQTDRSRSFSMQHSIYTPHANKTSKVSFWDERPAGGVISGNIGQRDRFALGSTTSLYSYAEASIGYQEVPVTKGAQNAVHDIVNMPKRNFKNYTLEEKFVGNIRAGGRIEAEAAVMGKEVALSLIAGATGGNYQGSNIGIRAEIGNNRHNLPDAGVSFRAEDTAMPYINAVGKSGWRVMLEAGRQNVDKTHLFPDGGKRSHVDYLSLRGEHVNKSGKTWSVEVKVTENLAEPKRKDGLTVFADKVAQVGVGVSF